MSRLLFLFLLIGFFEAHAGDHPEMNKSKRLKDVTGKTYDIKPEGKTVVYLFLSPECPLCRNYAPIVSQLSAKYKDVQFYGIVSGRTFTKEEVKAYVRDYKIPFPVLMDVAKNITGV